MRAEQAERSLRLLTWSKQLGWELAFQVGDRAEGADLRAGSPSGSAAAPLWSIQLDQIEQQQLDLVRAEGLDLSRGSDPDLLSAQARQLFLGGDHELELGAIFDAWGLRRLGCDDPSGAALRFRLAAALDPHPLRNELRRAAQGADTAALTRLQQLAVSLESPTLVLLGRVLLAQGQVQPAFEVLRDACERRPQDLPLVANLTKAAQAWIERPKPAGQARDQRLALAREVYTSLASTSQAWNHLLPRLDNVETRGATQANLTANLGDSRGFLEFLEGQDLSSEQRAALLLQHCARRQQTGILSVADQEEIERLLDRARPHLPTLGGVRLTLCEASLALHRTEWERADQLLQTAASEAEAALSTAPAEERARLRAEFSVARLTPLLMLQRHDEAQALIEALPQGVDGDSRGVLLSRIRLATIQGDRTTQEALSRRLVELYPERAEGYVCLATLISTAEADGAFAAGEALFEQSLTVPGGSPWSQSVACMKLATLRVLSHRPAEAVAFARRAAQAQPGHPQIWVSLAFVLANSGQTAAARELLDTMLEQNPAFVAAKQFRSNLLALLVQLGDYDQAQKLARRSIEDFPGSTQGYSFLALVLQRKGRHAEAAEVLRRGIDRCPDPKCMRHFLADSLGALGDHEGALAAARQLHHDCEAAVLTLSKLLVFRGRLQEALEVCRETCAGHPEWPQVASLYASLLTQAGDLTGLVAFCRRQLDATSDFPATNSALEPAIGQVLAWGAGEQLLTALEAERAQAQRPWRLLLLRSQILLQLGRGEEALAAARQGVATAQGPADGSLLRIQLVTLLTYFLAPGLRDPEQALVTAREAVELAAARGVPPAVRAVAQHCLGMALFRSGKDRPALDPLRNSLRLRGPNAVDLYLLAMARANLGELDAARSAFAEAEALFAQFPQQQAMLWSLQQEAKKILAEQEQKQAERE